MSRIRWSAAECVFVAMPAPPPPPRCPHCRSVGYQKVRTLPTENDGSQCRLVLCLNCTNPYKVVLEYPNPDRENGTGHSVN